MDASPPKALVTGSTQGIGKAIAADLLANGFHVTLAGRDAARCIRVREELGAHGYVAGDLTKPDGIAAVCEVARGVDVLVLNAGTLPTDNTRTLLNAPLSDYDYDLRLHAWSGVHLIRAAMPGMLERNWGRIITIGTEATTWTQGKVGMAPYITSKHLAVMIARLANDEAHGTEVTSNTVIVGPTLTEGVEASIKAAMPGHDPRAVIGQLYPNLPAGRPADPAEVAHVVTFLASPRSSAIRGETIRADLGAIPTFRG